MPPRLLSLLSLIEDALPPQARTAGAVTRSVDYRKGIARLSLPGGAGGIVVQNFVLAGGQLCVRVKFLVAGGREAGETAIYPTPELFDWAAAAVRVAREWRTAITAATATAPEPSAGMRREVASLAESA